MTRDEALSECGRPAREHADRATHSSHAGDPRPALWRGVGGPYGGV